MHARQFRAGYRDHRARWEEGRPGRVRHIQPKAPGGVPDHRDRGTGGLLREEVGLDVECLEAGPLGGDAQIAARVVDGTIRAVFFIVDPLDKHPHDPDIQTVLRVCNVRNVPLATNIATADALIGWPSLGTPAPRALSRAFS